MQFSQVNFKETFSDIGHRSRVKFASLLLALSFNAMLLGIISASDSGRSIGYTGLASVLPASYFAGLVLFSIFYLYLLFNTRNRGIMLAATAALVIVLFGTPLMVEGTPRFSYSFITGGVTDYILRTGHTSTNWDAAGLLSMFQNWPAAFILGALASLVGSVSVLDILRYTPVVSQLLYILPLYMVFSALFADTRKVFAGCFFFFTANWVNQEYFSAQNLGLFLALFIIALLLKSIAIKDFSLKYLSLLTVLFFSLVIAHALSSLFIYISVALFLAYVTLGRLRKERSLDAIAVSLLVLATFLLGTWSVFFTSDTMSSAALSGIMNIDVTGVLTHFQDSLSLGASTSSDQSAQGIVIGLKVFGAAALGALGLLAILAYALDIRKGVKDLNAGTMLFVFMLAADAILYLLPFYSYETVIRAYLLSIACLAGFIVQLIDHEKLVALLVVFLLVFTPVSFVIHYGKEMVDYISPCTINGLGFTFDRAPAGSALYGISLDAYRNYEDYEHRPIDFKRVGGAFDFEGGGGDGSGSYFIMNDGTRNFASRDVTEEYESRLGGRSDRVYASGDFVLSYVQGGMP